MSNENESKYIDQTTPSRPGPVTYLLLAAFLGLLAYMFFGGLG